MNDVHDEGRTVALVQQAEQMPVAVQSSGPMRLLEIAVNRGASVEELEKLMALAERHDKNLAQKAYVAAMAKFKQNPPTIVKNKTAKMQKEGRDLYSYAFADLAAVCGALVESLAQVGISHGWSVAQQGQNITVTCTLTHELGHSTDVSLSAMADTSGGKNSIQAIGSAVKYLERYTLLAATGIAVQDNEDDDGAGAGITPQDRKDLQREAAGMRNNRRPNPQAVAESRKPAARAKPIDPQLLADAQAAADQGRAAFDVFWKSINGEKRTVLGAHLEDFAARCDRADAPGAA
jgi:hypothetical protein